MFVAPSFLYLIICVNEREVRFLRLFFIYLTMLIVIRFIKKTILKGMSIEGIIVWVGRGGKRKSEGATGSDSSQGGTVGLWNNDCEQ